MSKNPNILRLFIRYLVGESSEKEKRQIEHWLKNDKKNIQLMQTLEELLHESRLHPTFWDEDELWNKFASKAGIALTQAEPPVKVKPSFKVDILQWFFGINHMPSQYFFRLALVALLMIGGTMGMAMYFKMLQEKRELAYQTTYQEYFTQKGERSTLHLCDGTSIHLNSATKIRFPMAFAKDKREIFLDGEAFFEVAHNETSPFIVHTADANIRVLGTIFNVTSYSEDNKTQVVVSEGQVAFGGVKQPNEVLLHRNQLSHMVNGGSPSSAEVVRTEKYLAWKSSNNSHASLMWSLKFLIQVC